MFSPKQWANFMMALFDYSYQNSFSFPFQNSNFFNPSGEQRTIALISMRKQKLKDSGSCSSENVPFMPASVVYNSFVGYLVSCYYV